MHLRWVTVLFLTFVVGMMTMVRDAGAVEILVGSGKMTLQSAVTNASDGDTLRIEPGLYSGSGFCGVVVEKSLYIFGNQTVTIDCEEKDRILLVRASVTIDGIIFKNGKSPGVQKIARKRLRAC